MSTAKVDLIERRSYISSTNKPGDEYDAVKTPGDELEAGALRGGGTPHLLSKESIGLLAQYAAVGLVYGTLPNLIYPFLTAYLNMEGTATTSAKALLSIPWSLKVFIGMISDCFPIMGYRRRPYMIFGWIVCAVCLLSMAFMKMPYPHFTDSTIRFKKPSELSDAEKKTINWDSDDQGGKYIILMVLASLGYLIADVAADAVVVEHAQREPEAIRGRTQTAIYATRTFFGIFASVILAFGLSHDDYGSDDFDFGISVRTVFLILGIFTIPVVPMTWFFIKEVKVPRPNFNNYMQMMWDTIQSRAVYQVIAYNFFSNVFSGFGWVASEPVTLYWAHATNFTINVTNIIGSAVMVLTLYLTGKYGLQWSWRGMITITMFAVLAIDVFVTMFTTWDIVRHQWFWLGVPIVEMVPSSVSFIVSTYVVVELASEGNEGAIYGLLTTCSNLGSPFAMTLTKNVNAMFDVWNDDVRNDTHDVRMDVTYTIMISYAMKILSLGFLVLLPPQKAATQELRRNGGSSKIMGAFTIFYFLFALCWSIMTNVLAIFPATKCLKITGGCHD